MRPSDLLGHGPGGAVHLGDLASMLHTDRRSVRLMIQRERLDGVPILSDNESGYYLPETPEQVERFTRSMRSRANEILKVAARVRFDYQKGGGAK